MRGPALQPIAIACPYCTCRKIETAVSVPYVRGYRIGTKTFVSCIRCARLNVLSEVVRSLVVGWFSALGVLVNPVFIVYNTIHTPFIGSNKEKARKIIRDLGIPDDYIDCDVTMLGYLLALSITRIGGKITRSQLNVACDMGAIVLPEFRKRDFLALVDHPGDLPDPQDVATQLATLLPMEGKEALLHYLWELAMADNEIQFEQCLLLEEVADCLDLDISSIEEYED